MTVSTTDLVRCARATLESRVAPSIDDAVTSSHLRATIALLHQVEARVGREWRVALDDVQDLRDVVADLVSSTDPEVANAARQALEDEAVAADLDTVHAQVRQLRSVLSPARRRYRVTVVEYLRRNASRQAPLETGFAGPWW